MNRRSLGRLLGPPILWWAAVFLFGSLSTVSAADRTIPILPATGVVDAVLAGYLADGIARAEQDGAPAVVIRLDTPGGDLQATQQIVSALLEASIPTIVWVAPAGGRAASAGTFITLAANVALMAPGTEIGAASPVGAQGEDIPGTLGEKVKNDAVAKIRSIAEVRGRNVDWAISTVDRAVSSPASEAVAMHAVDGIAATLEDVRSAANGRVVSLVGGRQVTIDLAGATFAELAMNPFQGFLHLLSDPNIAFILFTLGFYGLLFELQNPNFVTGILGGLAIILAFVGFGSLPLNLAGLLLIGFAIILFALEATVTSHGLLTVGGLVCFVLGASALYTVPGDPLAPAVSVALPLLVVTSLATAAFMGLIAVAAVRSRHLATSPGLVGTALAVGTAGIIIRPLAPTGSVRAGGEEWSARTADGEQLERGTHVRVVGTNGLTLVVEVDPSPPQQG